MNDQRLWQGFSRLHHRVSRERIYRTDLGEQWLSYAKPLEFG